MKKLNFIVEWESPKEKTWSGTVFGLYTVLRKRFNISEINICLTGSFLKKILRRLGLVKFDMAISELKRENAISERNIGKNDPRFQFAEVLSPIDYPNNYIYQDLSVPYLLFLSETSPIVFAYSGFAGVNKAALSERSKMQMEYYRTCKGIFTMGEWLRDDFVNRLGIEPAKVHCGGGE